MEDSKIVRDPVALHVASQIPLDRRVIEHACREVVEHKWELRRCEERIRDRTVCDVFPEFDIAEVVYEQLEEPGPPLLEIDVIGSLAHLSQGIYGSGPHLSMG